MDTHTEGKGRQSPALDVEKNEPYSMSHRFTKTYCLSSKKHDVRLSPPSLRSHLYSLNHLTLYYFKDVLFFREESSYTNSQRWLFEPITLIVYLLWDIFKQSLRRQTSIKGRALSSITLPEWILSTKWVKKLSFQGWKASFYEHVFSDSYLTMVKFSWPTS